MNKHLAHDHKQSIESASKAIEDTAAVANLSETFKLLGDPTRLKIAMALAKRRILCVRSFAGPFHE